MPERQSAAQKRVTEMHRHTALVRAIQEAITILRAPFSENDEIPGTIQDAIDVLSAALHKR